MKCILALLVLIAFTSCNNSNYSICTCEITNLNNGNIEFTADTLYEMNKEKVKLECINHSTSDDQKKSIICKIK